MLKFILVLFCLVGVVEASVQSTAAEGYLQCGGQAWYNVNVALWDRDLFDPDDLMGQSISDPSGYFQVAGNTDSFSQIDPELRIYHNCNQQGVVICTLFKIPKEYITDGPNPQYAFQTGVLELSQYVENQCKPLSNAAA